MPKKSKNKNKTKSPQVAEAKAAAPAAAAASAAAPLSKAAYVRAHAGKSGKEIFELAQKDNMGLSLAHIYAVQSSERKKSGGGSKAAGKKRGPKPGAKAAKAAKPATSKHAAASHSVNHSGDYERQVRDIIFHVGFNGLKTMIDRIHHEIAG